jgi:imidazolonepropionase-like amidohydrolase
MKKVLSSVAALLIAAISFAQNPAPAKPQSEPILVMNGTAHLGNGQVIQNAVLGFDKGKLILVGDATTVRLDKSSYKRVIDANGKQIYPGFIACNTSIGLTEIDAARATRDNYEVGDLNPNVRSIIAYNTDSKLTPTIRTNGILLAQVVPAGGTITGQSSVVELDGWNWEDAAYKSDEGIHLNWPNMFIRKSDKPEEETRQKENMNKALNGIEQLFKEAKAYSLSVPAEKNLRLEAMKGLFDGSKKLYVHCDYVKEIVAAINFCNRYKVKMVLVGGDDSWRVADMLKENNVPVILSRIHSLPPREDDDVDLPYKLPYLLKQAGVTYAMSVDGSWQVRNLPFMAGTSVEYGVAKEDALASITSVPAKILGIDATVGTLEVGKDATFLISTGDALDVKTNNVEMAFIHGKEINLDNVQKQLYSKYKTKYDLK